MISPALDLGSQILAKDACSSENAGAPSVITAAAGLDNVEVTGVTIDRYTDDDVSLARSASIATAYLAALGAAETVSLGHQVQYSDDGSSWDTAVVIEALTAKGAAGAGNVRGTDKHDLDLSGQKRYFRINVTLDLSAGATDTATFHTVAVLGGFTSAPVS